jgi:hypothetical protein
MAITPIFLGTTTGDKTGDGAKAAGKKINDNFAYLEAKIGNQNIVISETGFTLTGQDITMNALWVWKITEVQYTNPVNVVINIPFATTGNQRIDLIVMNQSHTFVRIAGLESASNPVAPAVPSDTIQATFFVVTDGAIQDPAAVVTNDSYVLKRESEFTKIVGSGAKAAITLGSDNAAFRFTEADSFSSFTVAANSKSKYLWAGKEITIKNDRVSGTLTIMHNSGTGNYKFYFPTAANLVLQPGEIVKFMLRFTTGNNGYLDYVGVAGSSGTADVSAKADITYVDAQDATALANAKAYSDTLITQIINGSPSDANTLKELNDKIIAVQAIIGNGDADADAIVNTVKELLAVFATFPEGVDLVTLLACKVNTTDVYNALDSIVAGKVLDARQGKVLNDLIVVLQSGKQNTLVSGTNLKTINGSTILGSGNLVVSADLSNTQIKDNQIEISANTNVSDTWNGQTLLFTANCTITVPASLIAQLMFVGRTLAGVTVTWATTAPFVWETTPTTTTEKKTFSFIRRGSTNTILLDQ